MAYRQRVLRSWSPPPAQRSWFIAQGAAICLDHGAPLAEGVVLSTLRQEPLEAPPSLLAWNRLNADCLLVRRKSFQEAQNLQGIALLQDFAKSPDDDVIVIEVAVLIRHTASPWAVALFGFIYTILSNS